MKNQHGVIGMAIVALITIVTFQNCSPTNLDTTLPANYNSGNNESSSNSGSGSVPTPTIPSTGTGTGAVATYNTGEIYGHCVMQLDNSQTVINNGRLDSSGRNLSHIPAGFGGATYPVTVCPHSGKHTGVLCAAGFSPVQTGIVQMDCRSSDNAPLCKTYYINYGCMKGSPSASLKNPFSERKNKKIAQHILLISHRA